MIWLLPFLSLMGTMAQSDIVPNFGLFFSPDFYYPSQEKFCIQTDHLCGFTSMSVNLVTSAGTQTLLTLLPDMPGLHCQDFQVPEPSKDSEGCTIEVRGLRTGGEDVSLGTKPVTLRMMSVGTFIQTNMFYFKPGKEVKFRVVSIDQDLNVVTTKIPLIELRNPAGSLLAHWKDVTRDNGIAEGSFQLANEVMLGKYKIIANGVITAFEVQEYVLPRFEVIIEAPRDISVKDTAVTIRCYARYTHGARVTGTVTMKVCQKKNQWSPKETTDLCYDEVVATDNTKKVEHVVDLGRFSLQSSNHKNELTIEMSFEEEGTGLTFTATKSITLKSQLTQLTFKNTKSYFQLGVPCKGTLSLTSYDGSVLAYQKIYLKIYPNGNEVTEEMVTDANGEAAFEVSTDNWGGNYVSLQAFTDQADEPYSSGKVSITYGRGYLSLEEVYVETVSYLHIHPVRSSATCDQNVPITVDYFLGKEEKEGFFNLNYIVVLNGKIVQHGDKKVERLRGSSRSGTVKLSLPIRDISPNAEVMTFIVFRSGAVATDTTTVQVTPCLKHDVRLEFSEGNVLPKSKVNMNLRANGGSLCAVRAVDESVILMKPDDELTQNKIQNLVYTPRTDISSRFVDSSICNDQELVEENPNEDINADRIFRWRPPSFAEKKKDIESLIHDLGLRVLASGLKIFAPITCRKWEIWPGIMFNDMVMPMNVLAREPEDMEVDLVAESFIVNMEDVASEDDGSDNNARVFFPEELLFDAFPIPSSGSADISVTMPDTMTNWIGQMFCVGVGSLGLSEPKSITVVQPFFIDLHLPNSVKHGETLDLKGSMFNYRSQEMMMQVTLAQSDQYQLGSPNVKTFCVGGGEKVTISWPLIPLIIGNVNISVTSQVVTGQCNGRTTTIPDKGNKDILTQTLSVVAEGELVEKSRHSILNVRARHPVSEKIVLELPDSYVEGSERAYITCTGDMMGSVLNNLGRLLTMSSGCAEQNMIQFAPNIYVLHYLNVTSQLTNPTLEKGKKLLIAGLQQQLRYKRNDGSYSAFGMSDPDGNTWLTAFVMKSFCQAQKNDFCFIDQIHIEHGLGFLIAQQQENGCFKARGKLFHNEMKGGVNDEVTLTAYVMVALLECGKDRNDPVVLKALQCLKNEPTDTSKVYKIALKAYAYTLTHSWPEHSELINILDGMAIRGVGTIYWSQDNAGDDNSDWNHANSVDVEISAYASLAKSCKPDLSGQDIADLMEMNRWMVEQQNAQSGYRSTQDTVMAIQSLSISAGVLHGKIAHVAVEVTSAGGYRELIIIDEDDRLLLQTLTLPQVPGEYQVKATGTGSVFLTTVLRYNIQTPKKGSAFDVHVVPQCLKNGAVTIAIDYKYIGVRPNTNMGLFEVNALSGYEADSKSLQKLRDTPNVRRVESDKGVITIYLDKVTKVNQSLEITFNRSFLVSGVKPALLKILDYYTPQEEMTLSYLSDCQ